MDYTPRVPAGACRCIAEHENNTAFSATVDSVLTWEDYGRSDERFTWTGSEPHALVVAASRLLTAIPAMIKLKMTAANSSNQPQYWPGWRRARMKCRP